VTNTVAHVRLRGSKERSKVGLWFWVEKGWTTLPWP